MSGNLEDDHGQIYEKNRSHYLQKSATRFGHREATKLARMGWAEAEACRIQGLGLQTPASRNLRPEI